jgi:hypothetical protein
MMFNTYALGLLATEKIQRFFRETERDRLAKEVTDARGSGRIGSTMHRSGGPRTATLWMIAGRPLIGFASLIRRDAARARSSSGE